MSPQVTAAIIAAGVGVLTVIATVAVQISGRRPTEDTLKALAQQREQLDKTLAAQREQLDTTLAEQRTRTFNERFATAAGQLGSDKPPEVRLAGVYAMAGLADDWKNNRQTCIDVLCGYLRMPYEPDPGDEAPGPERLAFRASREVRHTVIRVITAHLQAGAKLSWQGLDFDFTGVVFDGGDFRHAEFSGGMVSFYAAEFSGGTVFFAPRPVLRRHCQLQQRRVLRRHCQLRPRRVLRRHGRLQLGRVLQRRGQLLLRRVLRRPGRLRPCEVLRRHCLLRQRPVLRRHDVFTGARFSGGNVHFTTAEFFGGQVDFGGVDTALGMLNQDGTVDYRFEAEFSGGQVDFDYAKFSGGTVSFRGAKFSGGQVDFRHAELSGGQVDFRHAEFADGTVDFSEAGDWSVPPAFDWTDTPPPGVKLPVKHDQSRA